MPLTIFRAAFKRLEIAFEQFALGPDASAEESLPASRLAAWEESQDIYRLPAVWRRGQRMLFDLERSGA